MSSYITYAGVDLLTPTPEVEGWIEGNISQRSLWEEHCHYWVGRDVDNFPARWEIPDRPLKCNVLFWPQGATRWAFGHFLVSEVELAAIQAKVFASKTYASQVLTLSDDRSTLSTKLWYLPARPLAQIKGQGQLYLITLVDDRFFWWARNTGEIVVTEGVTTWDSLYGSVASILGISITRDTVNSAYLKPSLSFSSYYDEVPIYLDDIAISVGQRIVRDLDGTVRALNWSSSNARLKANVAKINSTTTDVQAGGTFAFSNRIELDSLVPASVYFQMPRTDNGQAAGLSYTPTVTLASLALPEFPSVTGYSGVKTFRLSSVAEFQGGGSPVNLTELTNLTKQIATDWYRHGLATQDVTLVGLVNWLPDGMHGSIEWTARGDECNTRVRRNNWIAEPGCGCDIAWPYAGTYGSVDIEAAAGGSTTVTTATINLTTDVSQLNITYPSGRLPPIIVVPLNPTANMTITATIKVPPSGFDKNPIVVILKNISTSKTIAITHTGAGTPGVITFPTGTKAFVNPLSSFPLLWNPVDKNWLQPTPAYVGLPPATTFGAPFNYPSGTAPTTPVTGDLWFGTAIFWRDSGTTKVAPIVAAGVALGTLIYVTATDTFGTLAGNTTSTKKFLTQTGTGSVSAAPAWSTFSAADLPGLGAGFYPAYQRGTTDIERWYYANSAPLIGLSGNFTVGANLLYAVPLVIAKDITLDRLAVNVTVGQATKTGRLGIYASKSDTNIYPGSLVLDAGTVTLASTGVKTITINQAMSAGYYWIVLLSDSTTAQVSAITQSTNLGYNSDLVTGPGVYLSVAQTFGALPGTYPGSGTIQTTQPPALWFRASS